VLLVKFTDYLEGTWAQCVIRVYPVQNLATGTREALPQCVWLAVVMFGNPPFEVLCISFDDVGAIIRGAAINDEMLKMRVTLRMDALYAFLEKSPLIIRRCDDGDAR
jgi:hypothetical protein